MNRIFFTGRTGDLRIFFTPKGEKVALFPVKIEDFETVEVLYLDNEGNLNEKDFKGKKIMVFGSFIKSDEVTGKMLRIKAKKIELLEE
ncbi:MAG: hypothetical protein N2513_02360 [Deltaproteobacteria bacterium]|nr:hypothetical protein [Deltaproteobacteria bacterium]